MSSEKLAHAIRTAAIYHDGQIRKGKNIPYIVHPVEVAMILQDNGMEEDIIIAGLLHDMLEDTDMIEKDLQGKFGSRVLELVKGASEKLENR